MTGTDFRTWAGMAAAAPTCIAALVLWRPTLDVFNTLKATVVVLGGITLVVGLVAAAAAGRPVRGWRRPWVGAVGAFVLALAVGVAVSDTPLRSVVGAPGRHGGLALYAACAVLALLGARADRVGRRHAVTLLLATSVPVALYALVQAVGADPFPWTTVEGGAPRFSTFGNVDFASAWMGLVGVLAMGAAATQGRSPAQRRVAAVLAAVLTVAAVLTGSLQGPVVLVLGAVVLGLVVVRRDPARVPGWTRRAVVLGAVAVVLVAVVTGVAGEVVGGALRSVETRVPKWAAAVDIASDAPLVGRGLDTYQDWFFAARTPEVAAASGLRRSVDNAHSVPLHLLTGGGGFLLLTWLLVVVVMPAVGAWRVRRAVEVEDAAILTAWGGYLLQGTVSIDVPPIAALGFLLTGLVAGLGGLLDPSTAAGADRRGQRRPASRRDGVATPVRRGAAAAAGVLVLVVVAGPVTRPLRADAAAFRAEVARVTGEEDAARTATGAAMALAPWDGRAASAHGSWLASRGHVEDALLLHQEALAREPRSLAAALNVARLLAASGEQAQATLAYARVGEIDPHTPVVQQEIAAHLAGTIDVAAPSPPADPGATGGRPEGDTAGAGRSSPAIGPHPSSGR